MIKEIEDMKKVLKFTSFSDKKILFRADFDSSDFKDFIWNPESKGFFQKFLDSYHRTIFADENEKIIFLKHIDELSNFEKKYEYLYFLLLFIVHIRENSTLCELANKSQMRTFYRGEENSEWMMTPSFLRKLNQNAIVDSNYIYSTYKRLGLIGKYSDHFESISSFNYELASFMQHSCSYSPFIDFTSNENVAKVFAATKHSGFNEYEKTKCKVYNISIYQNETLIDGVPNIGYLCDEDKINDFLLNNYKIYHISKDFIALGEGLEFTKYIDGKKLSNEIIHVTNVKQLFELLTPKIVIIDNKTNDRMKYQKGVFIVFYDCLSINGKIFYNFNINIHLKSTIYNYTEKLDILKNIRTSDYSHQYEYLLDSYKIFNE